METAVQTNESIRVDPVENEYLAVERGDRLSNGFAWISIALFSAYVAAHVLHLAHAEAFKLLFVLATVVAISISFDVRFRLQPKADSGRREVLISDSFVGSKQNKFWNNDEEGQLRLIASLTENSFFYWRLIEAEIRRQWLMVSIVVLTLGVALRFGTAETVELFAVVVLFGDLALGRLLRMLWSERQYRTLFIRCKGSYLSHSSHDDWGVMEVIALAGEYEYTKGKGAYRASARTFERLNNVLSGEWDSIYDRLTAQRRATMGARPKSPESVSRSS